MNIFNENLSKDNQYHIPFIVVLKKYARNFIVHLIDRNFKLFYIILVYVGNYSKMNFEQWTPPNFVCNVFIP